MLKSTRSSGHLVWMDLTTNRLFYTLMLHILAKLHFSYPSRLCITKHLFKISFNNSISFPSSVVSCCLTHISTLLTNTKHAERFKIEEACYKDTNSPPHCCAQIMHYPVLFELASKRSCAHNPLWRDPEDEVVWLFTCGRHTG